MDSSRVSIFENYINSTWFDSYEDVSESGFCIGVNSILFYKILNSRDKGQEININFDEIDEDKLHIKFTSEIKSLFDKSFEMPLMDINVDVMEIPEIEIAGRY
jgi:hypothetical protein